AVPGGIKNVTIDTTGRLADRALLDNTRRHSLLHMPFVIKVRIDGGLAPVTDRHRYRLYVRPDVWHNPIDGIKAGIHAEGDFLNLLHKTDVSVWWNTHVLQGDSYLPYKGDGPYSAYSAVNYSLQYSTPLRRNYAKLQLAIASRYLDGCWYQKGGLNWLPDVHNTFQVYALAFWRPKATDLNYLLTPGDWSSTAQIPNKSLNLAWWHHYNYTRGEGYYTFSLRAPLMVNNAEGFNNSWVQLNSVNHMHLGKIEVHSRIFGRYGTGNQLAYESLLYAAGASPEELLEDKYTRSVGFVPVGWQGISRYDVNHFQQGGGLNLRGYAGYNLPDERSGVVYEGYKGRSGAAANVEIDFEKLIALTPRFTSKWLHVDMYLFGDAGIMELSKFDKANVYAIIPTSTWSDLRVDAGLGAAITIKSFGVFEKAKPLTIRVDAPLFLNRPPYSNNGFVTGRYVVGVNRAF
ncbi:MAG: hypothetical protein EBZ77_14265, partial [Chitinophagia bacterium]|nr:hypothetical protein [Chitinophagia bacterium]